MALYFWKSKGKNKKSGWPLLIAKQRATDNRFRSSLIFFFWNNFRNGSGTTASRASGLPAHARGSWVSPWKIIKAASTVHVVSWWICTQYLHLIYWCSGSHMIMCGLPKSHQKLVTFICVLGPYCSVRGRWLPCKWSKALLSRTLISISNQCTLVNSFHANLQVWVQSQVDRR